MRQNWTCLNFLHSEVVGTQKPSFHLPSQTCAIHALTPLVPFHPPALVPLMSSLPLCPFTSCHYTLLPLDLPALSPSWTCALSPLWPSALSILFCLIVWQEDVGSTTADMGDRTKAPPLFPCANKVHVPHVGADKTSFKPRRSLNLPRSERKTGLVTPGVSKQYIKQISSDLTFSEDVVRDRCFHLLPYDEKYFRETLDISDIVSPRPKTKEVMGRYNNRVSETKHLPCHIKNRNTHQLQPLERKILEKALQVNENDKCVVLCEKIWRFYVSVSDSDVFFMVPKPLLAA